MSCYQCLEAVTFELFEDEELEVEELQAEVAFDSRRTPDLPRS